MMTRRASELFYIIFFNLFFEEDSAEERSEDLDDLKFKNFQEARIII